MEDIYALLNINKDLLQDFHLLAERTVDHQTELAISRNMRTLQEIEVRMMTDRTVIASQQTIDEIMQKVIENAKTENKETPFTVVDIDGPSGNVKTLHEGVKKMCLVHIGKNLPAEKKAEFLATLIAMKLKGEI